MTILATPDVFPSNAVNLIAGRVNPAIDADLFVTKRPLRESDPVQSVGVFASQWSPDNESFEQRGTPPGIHEPTLSSYLIGIQGLVKDMDEEKGLIVHGVLAKMLRTMLYRDDTLRVSLRSLSVNLNGSIERTQRFGIVTQRYLSNEVQGSWLYLTTIEFWLETETT